MNANNRLGSVAVAVAVAVAVFASPAMAAPPLKHTVWTKAVSVYSAQAKAHHATAACTRWDPTGLKGFACDFGAKGRVLIDYSPTTPCVYAVLVIFGWHRTPQTEHADLDFCAKRWSASALPAPWTFPRVGTMPTVGG